MEFPYDPVSVDTIKQVPWAKYHNDGLDVFWTIPVSSFGTLRRLFDLSPGHLYPDCMDLLPKDFQRGIEVAFKSDQVKVTGQRADIFIRSLIDLCKVIYVKQDTVIQKNLGEVIYAKNDTYVFQFAKGLYWRILDFTTKCGITPEIHKEELSATFPSVELQVEARGYQVDAVRRIKDRIIPNRATLVMATGAGKTILSALITAELGMRTIFYTYSLDLLEQTAKVYQDLFGQEIGMVGGDYFTLAPITVATVQTVHSCYERQDERWDILAEYLEGVGLMFVDEGHMLGAETIYTVSQVTNPDYAYALTATPEREDGKNLYIEAATGPAIELTSEAELVAGGYILPVYVDPITVEHPPSKGLYSTIYSKRIVGNEARNRLVCAASNKYSGKQQLIIVKEIKHGKKLATMLDVPFIHGTSKNRSEMLDLFRQKKINILIASSILKQGVDLPEAEVLILAHGGVSKIDILQKIGRVRRPAAGKTRGIVVDFYDYCPIAPNDILARQSQKRIALYRKHGYELNPEKLETFAAASM